MPLKPLKRKKKAWLKKTIIEIECKKGKSGTFLRCTAKGLYDPAIKQCSAPFTLVPDKDSLILTIIRNGEPDIAIDISARVIGQEKIFKAFILGEMNQ